MGSYVCVHENAFNLSSWGPNSSSQVVYSRWSNPNGNNKTWDSPNFHAIPIYLPNQLIFMKSQTKSPGVKTYHTKFTSQDGLTLMATIKIGVVIIFMLSLYIWKDLFSRGVSWKFLSWKMFYEVSPYE